jgi:hypothetical protein
VAVIDGISSGPIAAVVGEARLDKRCRCEAVCLQLARVWLFKTYIMYVRGEIRQPERERTAYECEPGRRMRTTAVADADADADADSGPPP